VIFLVQAPLCFLAFLVALARLPETERGKSARFDVAGTVLLGLGITSFLLAVNRGSEWGWTSPAVIGGFVVAAASAPAFIAVERRAEQPLLPLSWVRQRNITASVANQFLANFAYMGGFIVTPVLLEDGLGYSTAFVGLLVIARPLAFSISAPTAGYVTVRVRERVAGVTGAVVVFASMLLLARIDTNATPAFIVLALALSGIGLGVSAAAMTATVANAVPDDELGVAAALQQLMTQVGSVVGIQVMQTVQASTEDSAGLIGSFANAYYIGAVAALLAAGAAAFVRPSAPVIEGHRAEALAAVTQ
jgi:predicted MFS family arabinose efflux permease